MGRDKDRKKANRLEIAGCVWREFITRLHIVIKKVTIKLELIVTDLIAKSGVAAPVFLFRKGTRELIEVKAGQQTEWGSDPTKRVDVTACRSETVGTGRRSGKYPCAS